MDRKPCTLLPERCRQKILLRASALKCDPSEIQESAELGNVVLMGDFLDKAIEWRV
jgi:hypothetical protein